MRPNGVWAREGKRGEERSMNVLLKSEYPPFQGRNPPRPDCMFSPWEFTLYSNYSTTPMKPAFTNVAVLVRFIGKGEDRPRPLLSAGQVDNRPFVPKIDQD